MYEDLCLYVYRLGEPNYESKPKRPSSRPSAVQVMELRGYVTAFRGDWKELKQTFNFKRYADQDAVPGQKNIRVNYEVQEGLSSIYCRN